MSNRLDPAFLSAPIAHRGLHDKASGAIENAPTSIQRAIDAGFGIEIDVQRSADDQAMVFHDYKLDRLTDETGLVLAKDAAALGRITLAGSSDQIPTLAQVLKLVAGRVPLLVEIKDQDGAMGENVGPLEAAVAQDLRGYHGPVAVMSFNPHSVAAFAAHAPDVAIGLVSDPMQARDWPQVPPQRRAELARIETAKPLGLDFISHNVKDLDAAPVAALKAAGLPIFCWTVRSAATEAKARAVADNITFEGYMPTGPGK